MWPKTLTVLQPVALAIRIGKFGATLWPVAIVTVTPLAAGHHKEIIMHKHSILTV